MYILMTIYWIGIRCVSENGMVPLIMLMCYLIELYVIKPVPLNPNLVLGNILDYFLCNIGVRQGDNSPHITVNTIY